MKVFIGGQKAWLDHYHYDVFEIKSFKEDGTADTTSGTKITFQMGTDGEISSISADLADPSGDPVYFRREPFPLEVSDEQLKAYAGVYEISGQRITVTTKEGKLYMDVPGQRNYETIAQGQHQFRLKDLQGFSIRFEMNENGDKATAAYAIQPNGTFKATRVE